ncbi:ADP-forming succinate--CoA ligase subunit beta [Thioalkalivibrio sulfidiphilus]|uniref:Succinate--CoA ligase [ADP-forming] subunit beta n=1 Tax=Thioalkalivibrio sulfidiphilus (strain HL-EbGR7) TaxID=396588 RepID=SUCC_THISH|nr:ADP-forming succinate--CoA ligase subunit beta [Thioalkalivibrio sulfidiphilus]B8GN38.1 RecName: Full=Succinate--CoA ligase [ADP-forming] subunit beta; AltName: Full=Succinyl-CoA synthetase subunit beta; Short=SCS-beta [Thioalkalivibrio sulfidiphilus HL-EbGr7]ACL71899.1 succinyl-CoA synthetase, beta subunit [Thioalkalivibrio sulfidiphilus HL-EbGr7]
MNLHEFQAKALFREHGIPVPEGVAVSDPAALGEAISSLGGDAWVVKAQVHAGGRGKAGGVRLVKGSRELEHAVGELLGGRLATHQTGPAGLPINTVLVESLTDIGRELYLSLLVDRARRRVAIMASAAGGMDIETVAAESPEKIITLHVDPAAGYMPYQGRRVAFALGLEGPQVSALVKLLGQLYRLFVDSDASLVEINPLVVTKTGELIALDAKINLDDNGLYRHQALAELRDETQEDAREARAREHELNYVRLDGNIGCMVNGAGLAMATMDLIKLHGGEPANFLDVGGGTTAARVAEAFKLILSDEAVKAVFVNIFGGIVRCDLIAEGIINAVKEVHVTVPVVVRLEGTNVDQGKQMLAESGLNIITAESLTDGARRVVASVQ